MGPVLIEQRVAGTGLLGRESASSGNLIRPSMCLCLRVMAGRSFEACKFLERMERAMAKTSQPCGLTVAPNGLYMGRKRLGPTMKE